RFPRTLRVSQRPEPTTKCVPLLTELLLPVADARLHAGDPVEAQHPAEEPAPLRASHPRQELEFLLAGQVGIRELLPVHSEQPSDERRDPVERDGRRLVDVVDQNARVIERTGDPETVTAEVEGELAL